MTGLQFVMTNRPLRPKELLSLQRPMDSQGKDLNFYHGVPLALHFLEIKEMILFLKKV